MVTGLFAFGVPFHANAALEEVLVTATKRSESLQDVPISIGVVTGDTIRDLYIQDLTYLQDFVPGFTVQSTFGNWAVRVRGIGSGEANLAFTSSVSMFNDDVYCGRSRCLQGGFLDMERVEVARGPQGALFGSSTIAGAVSMISAKPTQEFEGWVRGSYEMENQGYSQEGVISGPLTDSLRGRVAIKSAKVGGYMKNTYSGIDEPETDKFAARGSLAWDATEDLQFNLKAEFSNIDTNGNTMQLVTPGLFGSLTQDPGKEFNKDNIRRGNTGNGTPEYDDMNSKMAVLSANYKMGEYTLTGIAAYWAFDYKTNLDLDGVPERYLVGGLNEDYDQTSLELRLLSPTGNTLEYLVGALYHNSGMRSQQKSLYAFIPTPYTQDRNYRGDTDLLSVFGQVTWHITDQLRLIGDARYSHTEQDGTAFGLFPLDSNPSQQYLPMAPYIMSENRTDESADPAIRLQFDLNSDMMFYVGYATGSKPGGMRSNDGDVGNQVLGRNDPVWYQTYLGQPTVTRPEVAAGITLGQGNGTFDFEDESAHSIEVGTKLLLADRRVSLNIAVFSMKYDNLQTSTYDGTRFIIANAASADIKGAEIEANWQVNDELSLSSTMSLLDAKYDQFYGGQCLLNGQGGLVHPGCVNGYEDLSGTQLERTPNWEGTLSVHYNKPLTSSLEFRGFASIYHSDEFFVRQDQALQGTQDAYSKWDLRAAIGSLDNKWEVALVGRNLGDEMTINHAFLIAGSSFVALGEGRTVSLEGTWHF